MEVDKNVSLSDSDTSSDEEEQAIEEEFTSDQINEMHAKLKDLEKKLVHDPYNYQFLVDRIGLLRSLKLFDRLEDARKAMQAQYPLTEDLWLDYIKDKQSQLAGDDDERHRELEELFSVATEDYICPLIWLEYIQYSIRLIGKEGGIAKLRRIIERGISAVGLHVKKGAPVWEVYIEIEKIILMQLQPSPGSISTAEQNDAMIEQVERINSIYKRQLAIPLDDMEKSMLEYAEWRETSMDGEMEDYVLRAYQTALDYLAEVSVFEKVVEEGKTSYDDFKPYIEHEKKNDDPARIRCVFERAVACNCLEYELWHDYLRTTVRIHHRGPVVTNLYKRALRNLPGVARFWQDYLLVLEKGGNGDDDDENLEKISAAFEDSLTGGFEGVDDYARVWSTWMTVLRRRHRSETSEQKRDDVKRKMRESFEKAREYLDDAAASTQHSSGGDYFAFVTFYASLEASHFTDVARSRELFEELTTNQQRARLEWRVWREWCDMEVRHGEAERAGVLLRRAVEWCAADSGDAEVACERLMRWEREHGDVKSYDEARKRVEVRLKKVDKRKEKLRMEQEQREQQYANSNNTKYNKKFVKAKDSNNSNEYANKRTDNKKYNKQQQHHDKSNKKRHQVDHSHAAAGPSSKKTRLNAETAEGSSSSAPSGDESFKMPTGIPPRSSAKKVKIADEETSGKKNTVRSPKSEPVKKQQQQKQATVAVVADGSAAPSSGSSEEKTSVFVSNLDYKLENVEAKLSKFFKPCGVVTSVSVAKSKNGKSRGFAYVSFACAQHVEEALKRDREPLEGRPLFVSPNTKQDDNNKNEFKAFKFSNALERHKLFVSGLSSQTTTKSLEQFFSQHGQLKSARIVTNRAGVSKGIAYVEYEKEGDASKAVMKCDGSKLDGEEIQVAISNPPKRLQQKQDALMKRPARTKVDFGFGKHNVINRKEQREEKPTSGEQNAVSVVSKKMDNAAFAAMFRRK